MLITIYCTISKNTEKKTSILEGKIYFSLIRSEMQLFTKQFSFFNKSTKFFFQSPKSESNIKEQKKIFIENCKKRKQIMYGFVFIFLNNL